MTVMIGIDPHRRGIGTTTRVWDVSDLENPQVTQVFENDTASIDTTSTPRVGTPTRRTTPLDSGSMTRVTSVVVVSARPDTSTSTPENDNATFEGGTWSNYPYFRQKGVVAVSSFDRGLFILKPRVDRAGN